MASSLPFSCDPANAWLFQEIKQDLLRELNASYGLEYGSPYPPAGEMTYEGHILYQVVGSPIANFDALINDAPHKLILSNGIPLVAIGQQGLFVPSGNKSNGVRLALDPVARHDKLMLGIPDFPGVLVGPNVLRGMSLIESQPQLFDMPHVQAAAMSQLCDRFCVAQSPIEIVVNMDQVVYHARKLLETPIGPHQLELAQQVNTCAQAVYDTFDTNIGNIPTFDEDELRRQLCRHLLTINDIKIGGLQFTRILNALVASDPHLQSLPGPEQEIRLVSAIIREWAHTVLSITTCVLRVVG